MNRTPEDAFGIADKLIHAIAIAMPFEIEGGRAVHSLNTQTALAEADGDGVRET